MSAVEQVIRQEILANGSISFARFMERALYCPKIGYYERSAKPVGRGGDFYTSVSVGPLFGELIALEFKGSLSHLGAKPPTIVEAGAHDGQLARDILSALQPDLPVIYWIIEPSETRREWQRAKLDVFADRVTWFASLEEMPEVSGILFCNELLDALPFHVLRRHKGAWSERKVALAGEQFAWRDEVLDRDLGQPTVSPELAVVLPEGFQIEVSPAATQWWQLAATKLRKGKLVTFDYGSEAEELLSPRHSRGTLRGYRAHRIETDVFANTGEQDITAHVNFSDIRRAGESAGLKTEFFGSQEKFLAQIVPKLSDWNSERVRQYQTLTHPDHLGRAFKVLVQSR
jgi:SAM-dependent MidA family methyltransferase